MFKRNQDQFSYVGFNFPLQQENLWDVNVPDKITTLLFNASRACNSVDTPPLGKVTALKSLFFSTLPYFTEKLPLPGAPEISKFQSDLDKIVWNGKKPKMKICNSVFPPFKGGLGMIDVAKCLQAQKLQVVQLALNTTNMEFWQSHLISLLRVPFDLAIRANLTYKAFLKLFIRPPPLFWQDAFKVWCSFHFCDYSSHSSLQQIEELVNRPASLNMALGSMIPVHKRFTMDIVDFFQDRGWFSVKDVCTVGTDNFEDKGFISKHLASKIVSSVPLEWKQTVRANPELFDVYTIGQKVVDQKFTQKELYAMIIEKCQDFNSIISKWNDDGLTTDWFSLTHQSTKIINGKLKNFFVLFNARAYQLNNVLCHFADTSNVCSLCKQVKETYVHLFWECPKVNCVWNYVHSLVPDKFRSNVYSFFPNKSPETVVFLFTLAKYYIYLCRLFSDKPNVVHIKRKIRFHVNALKFVYNHIGKPDRFEKV